MEVYYRLSSGDSSVRGEASLSLVNDLRLAQSLYDNNKNNSNIPNVFHGNGSVNGNGCGDPQIPHVRVAGQVSRSAHVSEDEKEEEDEDDDGTSQDKVKEKENEEEEELQNCAPSVRYALRRLIRGVGSSRESARQGFATALASLLEALPCITVKSVMNLMKKNLDVTSSMKGQEKRDGLLGQLFALGAIVTGKVSVDDEARENTELTLEITELLLSLAKKKVFLREPAITVLLHLLDKLASSRLPDTIFCSPLFQEVLTAATENQNADALLLALRLWQKLPTSIRDSCPLLPNSHSIDALFEPDHVLSLLPVLKDSSSCHPRVHPVWTILVDLLFMETNSQTLQTPKKKKKRPQTEANGVGKTVDERVASFWELVVDKSLLPSSHERKYLVMELLQLFLPRASAHSTRWILSETLVQCLIDNLVAKGNLLHKSAQRCIDFICQWAKADEKRIPAVILSLQYCSNGKFDSLTKTQTVKQLMDMLKSEEGSFLLYEKLVQLFNAKDTWLTNDESGCELYDLKGSKKPKVEGVKPNTPKKHWVLDQLCVFVKQFKGELAVRLSLQKEVVKFLTVNALFIGSPGTKCKVKGLDEEVTFPPAPLSEDIRNVCLARLQSLLVDVSPSASISRDKKMNPEDVLLKKVPDSSDPRFFFLELCNMLEQIPGVTRVQPISKDDRDAINALQSCLSQLFAVVKECEHEKAKKMEAMCSLLMQLLLRSVTSQVVEIAADLIMCCKRAFGDLIDVDTEGSDNGEELPNFIDVLIDILLSLLTETSAPIRAAAEQVFRCFCSDLTEASMLNLLRIVNKQLGYARRHASILPDMGNEDDVNDILELEETDDDDDEDNEKATEGSDDGTDDSEDESQGKEHSVADLTTNKSSKEKPDAAEDDPENSSSGSDSDMDDEAMFRIDEHLVNLLKQKGAIGEKGEGKDAQTQLIHFKFRVLSLLQFFFHKQSDNPLCVMAVPHLLQAFVASSSVGGSTQLADKISLILKSELFKSKKYPKGPKLDKSTLEPLLQKCLKLSSRSKVKSVRELAQACSIWLMKILSSEQFQTAEESVNMEGTIKKTVDDLGKIIQESMHDFFNHKKSFLKVSFFQEIFMRFPGLGASRLGFLLERCEDSRSECLKHQAIVLLTSVLQHNNSRKEEIKQFKEFLKQHIQMLSKLLVSLIEKPPNKRARKVEARHFCNTLLRVISQLLPDKPMKKVIGKSAYNLCVNHFGAPFMENILKSLQQSEPHKTGVGSEKQSKKNTSKKRSKKRRLDLTPKA